MKSYTREEMYFFKLLIENNDISYNNAVRWAYEQYTEVGAPDWIEEITLEIDSRGIIEIINSKFELFKQNFDYSKIIGEVSVLYKLGRFVLEDLVHYLYDFKHLEDVSLDFQRSIYRLEDALSGDNAHDGYIAEIKNEIEDELRKYESYGVCSYESYVNT